MSTRLEAIYEGGVFKPVSPPKHIAETQRYGLPSNLGFQSKTFAAW